MHRPADPRASASVSASGTAADRPPDGAAGATADGIGEPADAPFAFTDADGGLVFAVRLPGDAAQLDGARLGWDALEPAPPPPAGPGRADDRPLWINLDRMRPRAQAWLRERSGIDPAMAQALLDEETRPRHQEEGRGLLVILRGVNLNPGAEPDELIAIRIWIEPGRALTLRQFRFQTIAQLRRAAARGAAPATPGGLLAAIAAGLAQRIGPSVDNLEDLLDDVEEAMLASDGDDPRARGRLAAIRRQAIGLRRHLVPQRQALSELAALEHPLLARADRSLLRAAAEQTARALDALEEIRDRAAVNQDELRARHEARVGRTVYLLTIVATVALPLSLLTGLLGINVGGIPLADSPAGFAVVCAVMVAIAALEVLLFRRMRIL